MYPCYIYILNCKFGLIIKSVKKKKRIFCITYYIFNSFSFVIVKIESGIYFKIKKKRDYKGGFQVNNTRVVIKIY